MKLWIPALRFLEELLNYTALQRIFLHHFDPFFGFLRVLGILMNWKKNVFTGGNFYAFSEMSPDVVVLKSCNGNSSLYGALKIMGFLAKSAHCFLRIEFKGCFSFRESNLGKDMSRKVVPTPSITFCIPWVEKNWSSRIPYFGPLDFGSQLQNELDNLL